MDGERRPPTIVYDVRPLQTPSRLRGIGTVCRQLLESLSRLDHRRRYRLLCWRGASFPTLALDTRMRWEPLAVARSPVRKLGWLWDRWMLPRALDGAGDLFHYFSPFDLDLGWSSRPRRSVVEVYDLMPVLHGRAILRGRHCLLRPLFAWMGRRLAAADALISISSATGRDVVEVLHVPEEQVHVAPIAVSDIFRPLDEGAADAVAARLGVRRPYLLYVGGGNPNKHVDALLTALSTTPTVGSVVLCVSGSQDPTHALRRLARGLGLEGRTRWISGIGDADLADLYAAARLFVLPSRFEGFGLPVLEAMASGTPVACSDIAALRETGGAAATYFPPGDVAAMASAIERAWSDEPLRVNARRDGLERARLFSWDACARRVLAAYESML